MVQNIDVIFRFVTIHAFDRRTDGQTETDRFLMIGPRCSAVKITQHKTITATTNKQAAHAL